MSSVWLHASNFGTITSTCVWWAVADYEPKLRVRHHPKRLGMSRSPRNCEDSVVGLQTFTNELQFVDGTCAQGPFSKYKPPANKDESICTSSYVGSNNLLPLTAT